MEELNYQRFLSCPARRQWERIGLARRSGVLAPLFSVYSQSSVGIGEIPDLKILVDWCRASGMSLLQLLPMNDLGFRFSPYDAESTFALEPMYLALERLEQVDLRPFGKELNLLRKRFPASSERVDYGIKEAKLGLLWKLFEKNRLRRGDGGRPATVEFEDYRLENRTWLPDYALFKLLKERFRERPWWEWPAEIKNRDPEALDRLRTANEARIEYYEWLQWQLFEQASEAKAYASRNQVLLLGDLPFLVSRDSADVWSHPEYFKLHLAAGAPPDAYCSKGQRWGMPPYDWERIARDGYVYIAERLRYAAQFYDLFRIDHAVGLFRIWTIPVSEPLENEGENGCFDPKEEAVWEEHGRRLLDVILETTTMLPCAEDLGVIPPCTYRVLEEYAIPGMDVQRWTREWGKTYEFKKPEAYRPTSIATLASHDMMPLGGWWEMEAGTVEEGQFRKECARKNISFANVSPALFGPSSSRTGRLRWRKEIASVEELLGILRLDRSEAQRLVELYQETYGEKERFWNIWAWFRSSRKNAPFLSSEPP